MERSRMVIPQICFRYFRVQTFANVVHPTGCEDRTPCRKHILLSLVVSCTRTPEDSFARMRGSSLHKSILLVMFRVVCPNCLIPSGPVFILSHSLRFALHHLTSNNMLYGFGEGIVDRNQASLKRNFAGRTVWPTLFLSRYEPKTCIDVSSSTSRSIKPPERTASTLRITSLPQSHRARTPTVFTSKRQPGVAHNSSPQMK